MAWQSKRSSIGPSFVWTLPLFLGAPGQPGTRDSNGTASIQLDLGMQEEEALGIVKKSPLISEIYPGMGVSYPANTEFRAIDFTILVATVQVPLWVAELSRKLWKAVSARGYRCSKSFPVCQGLLKKCLLNHGQSQNVGKTMPFMG